MPPDPLQPRRCPSIIANGPPTSAMAVLLVLRGLAPSTRISLPAWPRAQGAKILHAIRGRRIAIPAGRVNTPFPLVCPAQRASHLAGSPRRVPLLPHLPRTSRPSSSAPYVASCASLARSMTRRDKTRTATARARSSKSNRLLCGARRPLRSTSSRLIPW